MRSMKVQQLARGLMRWEHEPPSQLSLGFKRLRPLAPKLVPSSFEDLKSFIRPQKLGSSDAHVDPKDLSPPSKTQVETHPGGTRWNPTQEQIGILEMLYRGGMRTPNAQQIEQITAQLSKFGKIEGKNVFYWFQNHKARERQKQKRNNSTSLGFSHYSPSPRTSQSSSSVTTISTVDTMVCPDQESPYKYKRKCRSWGFDWLEEESRCMISSWPCKDEEDTTLELFPLHPERGMKEFDSFKC